MAEAKTKKVIGPIWGWLLFTILGFIVYQLMGGTIDLVIHALNPDYYPGPACVIASLLFLLVYYCANRPELTGLLNFRYFGKACLISLIPFAVIMGIGLIAATGFIVTEESFWISAMAGVCEEITYRIIPIAHMMRFYNNKKKLWIPVFLTSLAFSLIHMINTLAGASLSVTLLQVYGCIGIGVMFAAVYMRTGCSIVLILFHFLNDVVAFMDTEAVAAGGVMTDAALQTGDLISIIVLSTLEVVYGIWLLRKSKSDEVITVWSEIWHKEKTEDE